MQQWLNTFIMHEVNIGSKPNKDAKRDAVHFAVAPVKSADRFLPGEHVGLNEKGEAAQVDNPIGIIDPFLTKAVEPGDPVWIMLYPKTVQNLRHDWDHPAFEKSDDNKNRAESEAWLKFFADACEMSFTDVIEAGKRANREPDYYFTIGNQTPDIAYDKIDLFWHHFAIVTGEKVRDKEKTFISCSC